MPPFHPQRNHQATCQHISVNMKNQWNDHSYKLAVFETIIYGNAKDCLLSVHITVADFDMTLTDFVPQCFSSTLYFIRPFNFLIQASLMSLVETKHASCIQTYKPNTFD